MVSGAGLGFGGFGNGGAAGRGVWVVGAEWQRKKHGDEDDFGFIATDIGTGGGVWVSRGDDRGAALPVHLPVEVEDRDMFGIADIDMLGARARLFRTGAAQERP